MPCAEKKGNAPSRGSLLAETCVASKAFVDGLQEKALAEARSAAKEALKQRKASQAGASTSSAGRPVCDSLVSRSSGCTQVPQQGFWQAVDPLVFRVWLAVALLMVCSAAFLS